MKKSMICLVALMPLLSCVRQNTGEEFAGNWNGYQEYLKTGEIIHTLWAGQTINVGTVTYGLDNNANFYVTYDCSASGWLISETHMFAGDKADMPINKPGAPKTGLFPYSGCHEPWVSTFTYRVPLALLPPSGLPGFVAAAHCVVHSPGGQSETAWAEGDFTFSDKGWGWYDSYYYDPPLPPKPVLYGTTCENDLLSLYHLDITSGTAELMLVEYVGNAPGNYDGAAYDIQSGIFFFTNYNTGELWLNQLQGEEPSFCAGQLEGIAASGTFYDGSYYYVNETGNTINQVFFNDNWMILQEIVLDSIPGQLTVNDVAMSPAGDFLYIMGQYNSNEAGLICWDVEDHAFFSTPVPIDNDAQVTFGSDGLLYAVAPISGQDSTNLVYVIEMDSDSLRVIIDEIIYIENPFTDLSAGPGQ